MKLPKIDKDRIAVIAKAAKIVAENDNVAGEALIRRVKAETAVRARAERRGKDLSARQIKRRAWFRVAARSIPDIVKKVPWRPFGGVVAGAVTTVDSLVDHATDEAYDAQRTLKERVIDDKKRYIIALVLAVVGLAFPALGIDPQKDAGIIADIVNAIATIIEGLGQ